MDSSWQTHFSSWCVCLCPGIELVAPASLKLSPRGHLSLSPRPLMSHLLASVWEVVVVVLTGGTWSCGTEEGGIISLPLLSHPAGSEDHVALGSFGFTLPLSLSVYLSLTTSLCPAGCWVMRRHRGYAEAGWESHNDLCILLLSRLLWRSEGELLTLRINIHCSKTTDSAGFHQCW